MYYRAEVKKVVKWLKGAVRDDEKGPIIDWLKKHEETSEYWLVVKAVQEYIRRHP